MDDMTLSDRFHAAFDVAPPAGGFERLRRELSSYRPDRRGRPAFHMRWNKMTLRLTAAAAVVIVAVALITAYFAAQRPGTSYVPAASDKTYRSINESDHQALIETYNSTDCLNFTDPSCAAAIATTQGAAERWLADLQANPAPDHFQVIDHQLRMHLTATIADLTIASAAITSGSKDVFNAVLDYASGHEAPWFDRMAGAIVYSKTVSGVDFKQVMAAQKLSLESCSLCGELGTSTFTDCNTPTNVCPMEVSAVSDQIAVVLESAVQFAAPSEFSTQASRLELDLANADTALLNLEIAILSGAPVENTGLRSNLSAYHVAFAAIEADITSILG